MTKDFLERIADALDRISPEPLEIPDLKNHNTFLWHASPDYLEPISNIASIDINLLIGKEVQV